MKDDRGGFAMVWLGEEIRTKRVYAIKQISTMKSHRTHLKEIWFYEQFFDKNGRPKPKFAKHRGMGRRSVSYPHSSSLLGLDNLVRLAGYEDDNE